MCVCVGGVCGFLNSLAKRPLGQKVSIGPRLMPWDRLTGKAHKEGWHGRCSEGGLYDSSTQIR